MDIFVLLQTYGSQQGHRMKTEFSCLTSAVRHSMTANLLAVRTLSQSVARSELLTAHEDLTLSKLDEMERQYDTIVRLNIGKDLTIAYLKKELNGYRSPQPPTINLTTNHIASSDPPESSSSSAQLHKMEYDWDYMDDKFDDNNSMPLEDGYHIITQIIQSTPINASLDKEAVQQLEDGDHILTQVIQTTPINASLDEEEVQQKEHKYDDY